MSKTSALSERSNEPVNRIDRFKNWCGACRKCRLREYEQPGDMEVDGKAGNSEYCTRLLEVYNAMRDHPKEDPPLRGTLLSHVPEWTKVLWVKDDISDEGLLLETLLEVPRLQAALATCTSYTPSKWLLEQELAARYSNEAMKKLDQGIPRDRLELVARYAELKGGDKSWVAPTSAGDMHRTDKAEDVYDAAEREQLAGLGLSGGGIRSATFCLGILQTLAAHGLIGKFDYISSVSGGGYIHEWLAAWIHREPRGVASVQAKMVPPPTEGSLTRAPEQINWLRRYSSYLTPQRGLFTADTWTMLAIWFRNTFLNQIVLFSFLAVAIVLVRAATYPFMTSLVDDALHPNHIDQLMNDLWRWVLAFAIFACLCWAGYGVSAFWRALSSQTAKTEGALPPDGALENFEVVGWVVFPGFLLSMLAALSSYTAPYLDDVASIKLLHYFQVLWNRQFGSLHLLLTLWVGYVLALLVAETWGGKALESAHNNSRSGNAKWRISGYLISIAICMLIPAGLAVYLGSDGGAALKSGATTAAHAINQLFIPSDPAAKTSIAVIVPTQSAIRPAALVAIFLPILFFATQFMAIRLQLGILGRSYEESRREWLARYGAWSAIVSFLWLALGSIALIGPSLFYWCFDFRHLHGWISAGVLALIHAVTIYSGSSSKTSGTPDPRKFFGYSAFDLVGIVGAPIAILSLLIVVSGLVDVGTNHSWLIPNWLMNHHHLLSRWQMGTELESHLTWLRALAWYVIQFRAPVLLFLVYAAVLLLFGWRVDVNEFSMHPFYRDRISRCYIGASNGQRVPDPFTGFDDHTEVDRGGIALADLVPARFGGEAMCIDGQKWAPYDGPMPIFCSTVNLTFGEDLAYQTRKGASFAFNPLWSGYSVAWTAERGRSLTTTYNGFVPTREFAYRATRADASHGSSGPGIPLATVTAVAGAALSPNDGYNSQPALAFLMTLFNARLGWWIANPRKPWIWPNDMDQPTPRFGLRYLLSELFGRSDDTSNYVNLSDGGFFDNMGLYELVRRRCSLIVICDGEEDANTTFEGIGLAIAKARIDFGVEIDFPREEIDKLAPNKKSNCSRAHYACGTITYPAPPGERDSKRNYSGKLVYLKSAFFGDEPLDIIHYKREHPDFPEESTMNQWFTEPQFESYRRLGQLTAERAISDIDPHPKKAV